MASREHIIMVPFMAHGHFSPFLTLARQLHHRFGFTITIASTPLNIQYLHSIISQSPLDSNIHLAELTFCSIDHGLPPNTENTKFLPMNVILSFVRSTVSLKAPLHQLVRDIINKEGKTPLCIIADTFFGWAVDVGKGLEVPVFTLNTSGAYSFAAYISIWMNLPHRFTDSDDFTLPGFPNWIRFKRSQLHRLLKEADGKDTWSQFLNEQFSASMSSDGWLCNTVEDIEPLGSNVLKNIIKNNVWCVGPLLPTSLLGKSSIVATQHVGEQTGKKCMEWLNQQSPNSVLYISFGSQNTIGLSQMKQLAKGIQESGVQFIWAIKPPVGFEMNSEFKAEWLPEGFEEQCEVTDQGLLVKNWAPQLQILSHNSTGAFLSHCGWNSVLESLSQGVPIIGWPLAAEQLFNSKVLVEEMGVNVELNKGVENVVDAKEVKKVVEIVMDANGKGGDMRKKVAEIGEMVRNAVRVEEGSVGSSVTGLTDFVKTALALKN